MFFWSKKIICRGFKVIFESKIVLIWTNILAYTVFWSEKISSDLFSLENFPNMHFFDFSEAILSNWINCTAWGMQGLCKPIGLTRLSIRFMLKVYIVTNLHIGTLTCKFLLLKGLKMSIFKCVPYQNCWSKHNNTISTCHSSIVIQGYNNTMLSNYFLLVL